MSTENFQYDWNISNYGVSNMNNCFYRCSVERIEMSRVILYFSVATIAFIVGVAANWSMNTFGCFAVDKLYVDASIPSLLQVETTPLDAEAQPQV